MIQKNFIGKVTWRKITHKTETNMWQVHGNNISVFDNGYCQP